MDICRMCFIYIYIYIYIYYILYIIIIYIPVYHSVTVSVDCPRKSIFHAKYQSINQTSIALISPAKPGSVA